MLKASNTDVVETLRRFSDAGIDCAFLVPTAVGLGKSILDATAPLRALLKRSSLHDYDSQLQGQQHKVTLPTLVVSGDAIIETTASLYRPETKSGDPRIWFSKLPSLAGPTDLLAIVPSGEGLIVLNCSRCDLARQLADKGSVFWTSLARVPTVLSPEATELLELLRGVGARGYLRTLRPGDTGVGYTLETLLGIQANSRKAPDFKGIELKAGRAKSHASGRTTIFSQVPDWSLSRLKGSRQLLDARGRYNDAKQRRQLFHEIDAIKPNSYGLMLQLADTQDLLDQVCVLGHLTEKDVCWPMAKLSQRLLEKHKATFWVTADCKGAGSSEHFLYSKARYTSGANAGLLPTLLEAGVISVDYTIKETPAGGAKDQGYLFKIRQRDLPLLFVAPLEFELQ